jgi:hypothetical protein
MHASLSHIALIEALANRMGPYMLPAFHTSPSMISDEGKGKRYVEDQAHGGFESIGTIAPQRTVLRDQTWNLGTRFWNRLSPKALQRRRSAPPKSLQVHVLQHLLPRLLTGDS